MRGIGGVWLILIFAGVKTVKMGKYNKVKSPCTGLASHKRVCRKCGLVSYRWLCCGKRTARFAVFNRPEIEGRGEFTL